MEVAFGSFTNSLGQTRKEVHHLIYIMHQIHRILMQDMGSCWNSAPKAKTKPKYYDLCVPKVLQLKIIHTTMHAGHRSKSQRTTEIGGTGLGAVSTLRKTSIEA